MFDRIAGRYDLLNRLLSLRRDVAWRKRLAKSLPDRPQLDVLDIATGTADVLLCLLSTSDRIQSAVGLDMSPQMLRLGLQKITAAGLQDRVLLVRGDALQLPLDDSSFDAVTIAFGIRNLPDMVEALREMYRVLKPAGRLLVLEFSMPDNSLVSRLYPFHLRGVIPRLGAMISGDSYAYQYLNETVQSFPYGDEFCALVRECGFINVRAHSLTFGIATIYESEKAALSDAGRTQQ